MQTLHISAAQVLHAAVAVGVAVAQDALVGARRCNRRRAPIPFLALSPNLSDAPRRRGKRRRAHPRRRPRVGRRVAQRFEAGLARTARDEHGSRLGAVSEPSRSLPVGARSSRRASGRAARRWTRTTTDGGGARPSPSGPFVCRQRGLSTAHPLGVPPGPLARAGAPAGGTIEDRVSAECSLES